MKCVLSISLLVSIFCITTSLNAETALLDVPSDQVALLKKRIPEQRHPENTSIKTPKSSDASATTAEKKEESTIKTIPALSIKTVEQVIKETTDKNRIAQFGIAAMLKAFKEQAANNSNPDKTIFERDAKIGDEIVAQTRSLEQAKHLVLKLDQRTQKALLAAIKQYPIFKQKGVADEFFKARS